jgi:tRNA threonylcarbamoyl adenosine modification protein (Sua5/YciO/YrdC/YwlC family)
VFEVDPDRAPGAGRAVRAAAAAIRDGALVVLPTETVYGIAARPDDPAATGALFAAKRRPTGLALPVLVGDPAAAFGLGRATRAAEALAAAFWPGPLTLILERTEPSAGWDLGDRPRTIGLRVPDHPLASALIGRSGPIAATSANISGEPPLEDAAGLLRAFGEAVAVYLIAVRPTGGGIPSTVVDLTGERPRVVREGAISLADVERATGGPDVEGHFVDSAG